MKVHNLIYLLFLIANFSFSQTEVPSFFMDNMVLQQQKNVPIWGEDTPGTPIKIETSWGENVHAKTASDGRWKVAIKTKKASFKAQNLTITGSSTIKLKNILIGEVWFCSGQSNMEIPMKGFGNAPINNAKKFIQNSNNPNIRLFNMERSSSLSPEDNVTGKWEQAKPESVTEFSAIGYLFGKRLYEKLEIPIGVIESSWGGTQIESWLPKESALKYPIIEIPKSLPTDQNKQKKPTCLYNGMIHPFENYAVKGILWYQGESNRNHPEPYKDYMHSLVNSWRAQWKNPQLPFYSVQIAPYGYEQYRQTPVLKANLIREAQALAAQEISHSDIVITTDVGKCDNIHPPEKEIIANRLANMALGEAYKKKDIAFKSPEYKSMKIDGNKMVLSFDFGKGTKENQKFDTGREIQSFVIAGVDKIFHPAKVTVNNDQTLTVYSDAIKEPSAVRYGFKDCLQGTLFSKAGLPVSPFRTDSWKE